MRKVFLIVAIYLAIGFVNAGFMYKGGYVAGCSLSDVDKQFRPIVLISLFAWPLSVVPNIATGFYSTDFTIPFTEVKCND